ncbi:MAG: flagellar hook-basal body complex protein FliE [Deltaproteobacteria bacterium]|nr:flagellar hook-basal body complex protein FliE [Deltaproteobacteria bacterium]
MESIKGAGLAAKAALNSVKDNLNPIGGNDTFSTVLKDSIEKVNNLQTEADQAMQGLAKGEVTNIHDTMIAVEKANLSFNMMVQVRNKLVQAYEEIMRTQV